MLTREYFHKLCKDGPVLLDGATGSNLMKAGMSRGCCTEKWISYCAVGVSLLPE